MRYKKIAIIGGGFAGVSLAAALVRAAVDAQQTTPSVTIFEPGTIGPGLAYDVDAPDAFILNHELDYMGSLNVNLHTTEPQDFYHWVQQNYIPLSKRYGAYDLTNPKAYAPRSLFGAYLQARYQELQAYAASHGIEIIERHHKVDDVHRLTGEYRFGVEFAHRQASFDAVVLTTGNYFNQLDGALAQTGKCFRTYDYKKYVSDAVADGLVLLIAGTALYAYDAAICALESGKYRHVIMASRRGMLRKVRGKTVPYVRHYVTIDNLTALAGGAGQPFRLAHLLQALRDELKHAYDQDMHWKEGYSSSEVLSILQRDIEAVQSDETLLWRSIHMSITDDERHEFYDRLADEDKAEFVQKYSSLYQLFNAPMPLTNALKLQQYVADGKLELVSGMRQISYNAAKNGFELWYAHQADGVPVSFSHASDGSEVAADAYPVVADVCIDAMGLGRAIGHVPLYRRMIASGLAVDNPLGGIRVDMGSCAVKDVSGDAVPGLYAIGHMVCGETVLTHSSLQVSRRCHTTGAQILCGLGL